MAQNAVAYLSEIPPMAKLKCALFLIIYVLHKRTIFTKVNKKINVLKRKLYVYFRFNILSN